jgi:hypothetical protein
VNLGGRLGPNRTSVEVDGIHLCVNMLLARQWSAQGVGAIQFTTVAGYSFKVCITEYTLRYPNSDVGFRSTDRVARIDRRDSPSTPADGFQYWRLPQGTYTLAVEVYQHTVQSLPPVHLGHFQRQVIIDRPHWNWQTPGAVPDYQLAVSFGAMTTTPTSLTAGPAPCSMTPTPSVGIGSINVRLEWRAEADLDLWVYDPCGNKIYYANTTATCSNSAGQLDQDNLCTGLVLGRPENIFWAANPPRGTYTVVVDYFSDCATTGSVFYNVRWLVGGQAFSKSGTIAADTVLVTRFTY